LTLVELDGVEVEPLAGQPGVYLNIGQRVSVLIDAAAAEPGNYRMRASLPRSCFLPYATYTNAGLEDSAFYEVISILAYGGVGQTGEGEEEVDGSQTYPTTGMTNILPTVSTNPFGADNNPMREDVL